MSLPSRFKSRAHSTHARTQKNSQIIPHPVLFGYELSQFDKRPLVVPAPSLESRLRPLTRTNVQRFPNSPLPLHRTLAAKHSTKLSPAPLTRGEEGGWGNSDHPPRSLPLSDRTLLSLPSSIVREKPLAQRVPPMAAAAAKLRVTHSILSLAFASHLQSEGLSLPASRARGQAASAGSRNLSGPSARHEVHPHMHKCLGNGGTGQAGNRVDGSYW